MPFRIRGLSPEPFAPLFALSDGELAERNIQRVIADEPHAAPCRVSLVDAEPGERLLLLSYEHVAGRSPFRASGPIFVREAAREAFDVTGETPAAIATRTISARAYDAQAMMIDGDLVQGADLAPLLEGWFARPEVDVVHLHYARRGCYAALAQRA
jgi:hypothetical protein